MNVVIIGGDSYVGKGLESCFSKKDKISFLYYYDWEENIDLLRSSDYVINFSLAPNFLSQDVNVNDVLDVQIANSLIDCHAKFIFISSRKVYGTSNECCVYSENAPLNGFDFYSKNKVLVENKLQSILLDRLLILRIANVIGEPIIRSDYKTFIGWISENFINNGKLIANQNLDSKKDFVTKNFIHKCIYELMKKNAFGVFNVSSGFGIRVRDILTGYVGSDNLICSSVDEGPKDQFILSNKKIIKLLNVSLTREDIFLCLEKYKNILQSYRKD